MCVSIDMRDYIKITFLDLQDHVLINMVLKHELCSLKVV